MKPNSLTSVLCLINFTRAALIVSPNGLPAGSAPLVNSHRNRTNFNAIFSEIFENKEGNVAKSNIDVHARDVPPPDPTFFQLVFGPTNDANDAVGFMGFVSLPSYDVSACAQQCNTRAFDARSGPCIYFNIWTAVVNGTVSDNVCSLYNTITDASTATNGGQGSLQVTASRGYSRISLIQDGSFQDFTCVVTSTSGCLTEPSAFWARFFTVGYDLVSINNFPARSGTSSALFLLEAPDTGLPPNITSTITYIPRINTVAGKTYILSFFYTPNNFMQPLSNAQDPFVSALWNGEDVFDCFQPDGATLADTSTFFNGQAQVIGTGSDVLVFTTGPSGPHEIFLDDISLFEQWS